MHRSAAFVNVDCTTALHAGLAALSAWPSTPADPFDQRSYRQEVKSVFAQLADWRGLRQEPAVFAKYVLIAATARLLV